MIDKGVIKRLTIKRCVIKSYNQHKRKNVQQKGSEKETKRL